MAAIRPPKEYEASSSLTPELMTSVRRYQEEAIKAASLLSSFAELAISQESSQAALHLRASNAEKAVKEAEKTVQESERLLKAAEKLATDKNKQLEEANEELTQLQTSIGGLNAKVAGLETSVERALMEKSDLEANVNAKAERIKELKAEYTKVKDMLRQAVKSSFENAVELAEVLNPGLVTEGIGYTTW